MMYDQAVGCPVVYPYLPTPCSPSVSGIVSPPPPPAVSPGNQFIYSLQLYGLSFSSISEVPAIEGSDCLILPKNPSGFFLFNPL
jgi:hypothetical protein